MVVSLRDKLSREGSHAHRDTPQQPGREVLRALISEGPTSRIGLVRKTGFSKATISRVVDELIGEGLVRESDRVATGEPGRRPTLLELVAGCGFVCGIDLGGTSSRFMVSDLAGRLLAEGETKTPTDATATELAEWLAAEVERLLGTAGGAGDAARGRLLENVVAVPGVVDPRDGAIRFAPNLPQVEGRQFVEELQARLAGNVSFDNGANLALVGESHYGAAHAVRAAVMFTIGTGVGAGVALDGNLLRGCSGFVGEFGYLTACGSKMTVEDALSGPGLALQARAAGVDATLAADILVDDGSPALSAIREFVVATIAELVLTVTAAYEPEVIVFGGRVAPALATLLAAVTERLAASGAPPPPIVVSELGPAAGPLGAVVAALQNAWLREDVPFADLENMALPAHLSKAVCTFSDPAATVAAGSVSRARPTADAVGAKHEKGKR